jgi:hypothetical protein
MPYELAFVRRVPIADRTQYINECCVGGDVVVNHLRPAIEARYEDVWTDQEDWGWFLWFRQGAVKLAVDVFTDDPDTGSFRIRLTSRIKRLLMFDTAVDTPELETLKTLVVAALTPWVEGPIAIVHDDE